MITHLTMLINIIKIQVPAVPNWEIQVGKKHIASICLNGTFVKFDPGEVVKQNHWESLSLSVLQTFLLSSTTNSSYCRLADSFKPLIRSSIAIEIFRRKGGIQPKNKNTILIGSATRHVKILNIHSEVRRELIINAIPSLVLINQI